MDSRRAQRCGDAVPLLLLLGVAGAIAAWIVAGGRPVGLFSDSISYLHYADFYRGMFGDPTAPGVAEAYRASRYPPLYPLLLALADAGAVHAQRALAVTNAVTVMATAVLWLWLRRELGHGGQAMLVALAVILTPSALLLPMDPASEPLLVLLTVGACALAAGARGGSRVFTVAALVGAMPLARMAALPFVAAGLLWVWRQRELAARERWLAAAVMLAPGAAWLAYRSLVLDAESYASAVVGPGALLQIGHLGTWLARESLRVVDGVGRLWLLEPGAPATALGVALLALALIGTLARLRRNALDAPYLPGYLALVLVWPYPAETERLLVVVIPFLVVAMVDGARAVAARLAPRLPAVAPLAVPGLLLAVALPALVQFVIRAATPLDAALAGYKREQIYLTHPSEAFALKIPEVYLRVQTTIATLPRLIPHGACVYAAWPQVLQHWAAGVTVQRYPRALADAAQARRELTRCDYFFVASITTPQFHEPALYPLEQLADWTRPVIANHFDFEGERLLAAAVLQRAPGAAAAPAVR